MNNGVFLKASSLFQIPFSPTSSLLHPNKTFLIQLPKHRLLSFHVKIPSGSPVFASKTPTKGEISIPDTENFDLEDEFDEEFEEDEEDEEDEDEDIIVPLKNMKQWIRNKPSGFGEGKAYDTSVEDKLMEELEQSRVAQIANVSNLKNNPEDGNPNSKNSKLQKQKVSEAVPNGIRVRLVNLPKKKNIHRDLQAAFKSFSGINNIIPAVSGNEKTREPICKGFAFVDFKSEKDAKRFIDKFSTQPINFGKVEKQIKCEIMKSTPSSPASVKPSVHKTKNYLPVLIPNMAIDSNPVLETLTDSFVKEAVFENDFKKPDDGLQQKHESETGSGSSKKQKKVAKRKVEKAPKPKLNVLGSANRLKMKEKALLSGVFEKYGGKSAMAAK